MTAQLAAAEAFDRWTTVADTVRATTKRLRKLAALVEYLPTLSDDGLAIAARFFSGIVFPRHDARTTQVGGSILWNAVASLTGPSDEALAEAYGRHGDPGDMVGGCPRRSTRRRITPTMGGGSVRRSGFRHRFGRPTRYAARFARVVGRE